MNRRGLISVAAVLAGIFFQWHGLHAQRLTLDEAIGVARMQSVEALAARSSFVSSYWAWRSWKASRLPSLNLYGNLASFDRSLRQLQNFETGELVYTSNYNMQNSLGLSIRQNIGFTGGTLSLYSDLTRIDEFGQSRSNTWYSQPVTVSYSQPLFAYNSFKWARKISPKEYEKARRVYVESMEEVTIKAVDCYFALLVARNDLDLARKNFGNTTRLLGIARERMKIGSTMRDEYLQLELRMLNDSISINENSVKVREAQMALNSLLGFDDRSEVEPVQDEYLPDIAMDYDMVLAKALENSSFSLDNEISLLTAESDIAQARAARGYSVEINARFGLSNSDSGFRETYRNLVDQEVVGLTFSIPVFDWGMGRGRVKEAEAAADVVRAKVAQAENDFRRSVFTAVGQFNNQRQQCNASRRASEIAEERYGLMIEKFRNGTADVTDLNTARAEYDSAAQKYITDIKNFWNYYYTLRKLTLYDFISGQDLDVPEEEMVR